MSSQTQTVIDIGTNSVLLLVAKIDQNYIQTVRTNARVTGLGKGLVGTNEIQPMSLRRTIKTIRLFLKQSKGPVTCLGTHAFRVAKNQKEVLRVIEETTGQRVQVLSPEDEAHLSYLSVTSLMYNPDHQESSLTLVVDIGGGSTEFILGRKRVQFSKSIPMGVVTLNEQFHETQWNQMTKEIAHRLNPLIPIKSIKPKLIVIGGTGTTLARVHSGFKTYSENDVEGLSLRLVDIQKLTDQLRNLTIAQRLKVKGLPRDRVDTIIPGCAVLLSVMNFFGRMKCSISNRGIRYGYCAKKWKMDPAVKNKSRGMTNVSVNSLLTNYVFTGC